MEVKFIAGTKSIFEINNEELICYIARVSTNKTFDDKIKNINQLLKYCIKNNHWSIFEHNYYTFEIKTSVAISRQILRHRSFTFQEFSQRYSEVETFENVNIRKQSLDNRQSSIQLEEKDADIKRIASAIINEHLIDCKFAYQELLKLGVAKEVARMILPMQSTTTMYMTGSLRSWLTYLNQRLEEHTQVEHREIAQEIAKLLKNELPLISEITNNFNEFRGNFITNNIG